MTRGGLMGLKPRTPGQMVGGEEGRWVCQAALGALMVREQGQMCQSGRSFHSLEQRPFFLWGHRVSLLSLTPLDLHLELHRVTPILSPDVASGAPSWRQCPQVADHGSEPPASLLPRGWRFLFLRHLLRAELAPRACPCFPPSHQCFLSTCAGPALSWGYSRSRTGDNSLAQSSQPSGGHRWSLNQNWPCDQCTQDEFPRAL